MDQQDKSLLSEYFFCNQSIAATKELANGSSSGCPPIWDGILCWDATPFGHRSVQPCPKYIAGFDPQENATKHCTENGWFFNPSVNSTWTDFSRCFKGPEATIIVNAPKSNVAHLERYLPPLKAISATGYTVSLVSLLAAFCILATVKKLRCPRNMLHLHLFASFIMRAFMALLKDSLFVQGLGLPSDIVHTQEGSFFGSEDTENWECKMITSMWQYFIMANYSWILMEGLYLHNLIFLALFSDTSAITLYVSLGWGLPAVFVISWVTCRALLDDVVCWTVHARRPQLFLLVRVPIVVSIIVSFGLFVNIVRVLFLKLRATMCEETRRYRRWAKSTLVLVPLFGVHYTIFIGLSYSEDPHVELIYLFCDQLFASFQGFFVAVLYCFLNGEVRAEVGRKWRRLQRRVATRFGGGGGLRSRSGTVGGSTILSSATGIITGVGAGDVRVPPSQTESRFSLQRASCYSTTSCTSLSIGGASGGGSMSTGGINGAGGSGWWLNKRRSGGAFEGSMTSPMEAVTRSCHSGLADHSSINCFSNLSELSAPPAEERRWSSRSEHCAVDSALEMQSIGNI